MVNKGIVMKKIWNTPSVAVKNINSTNNVNVTDNGDSQFSVLAPS